MANETSSPLRHGQRLSGQSVRSQKQERTSDFPNEGRNKRKIICFLAASRRLGLGIGDGCKGSTPVTWRRSGKGRHQAMRQRACISDPLPRKMHLQRALAGCRGNGPRWRQGFPPLQTSSQVWLVMRVLKSGLRSVLCQEHLRQMNTRWDHHMGKISTRLVSSSTPHQLRGHPRMQVCWLRKITEKG
jgi:hypothetical protein